MARLMRRCGFAAAGVFCGKLSAMESTHVCPNGTRLVFNDKTRIVDMAYPGKRFFLNDADEIKTHFDSIRTLWQDFAQRCKISNLARWHPSRKGGPRRCMRRKVIQ